MTPKDTQHVTQSDSPESARDVGLKPGMLLGNRYLIEAELGRGGIGAVYLARDKQLASRLVVVKVLLERSLRDKWVLNKFRHEIDALTRIDHPNIVGIFDAGE